MVVQEAPDISSISTRLVVVVVELEAGMPGAAVGRPRQQRHRLQRLPPVSTVARPGPTGVPVQPVEPVDPSWTGRRTTGSRSRTRTGSRRIHCAAGAASPSLYATIGGGGSGPSRRSAHPRSRLKVGIAVCFVLASKEGWLF